MPSMTQFSELPSKPGTYGLLIEVDFVDGIQWVVQDQPTLKAMLAELKERMLDVTSDPKVMARYGDKSCLDNLSITLLGEVAGRHRDGEIIDAIRDAAGLTDDDSISFVLFEDGDDDEEDDRLVQH